LQVLPEESEEEEGTKKNKTNISGELYLRKEKKNKNLNMSLNITNIVRKIFDEFWEVISQVLFVMLY